MEGKSNGEKMVPKDLIYSKNKDQTDGGVLPSINAIVPICNWEDRLEFCLERLSKQKYEGKFSITVVDCGSSDNTINVALKYRCKILIKKCAPVDGLTGLINFGISKSRAELVWIVNADNLMADDYVLERLVKPFTEDGEVMMSIPMQIMNKDYDFLTNYLTFRETIIYRSILKNAEKKEGWYLVDDLWYGVYNSTLIRKRCIDDVGGWDIDIRVLGRLREKGLSRSALVPSACYYHDQRADPINFIKKMSRRIKYFGSMKQAIIENYFVDTAKYPRLEDDFYTTVSGELQRISMIVKTKKIRCLLSEFVYLFSILLSLASRPVSAYQIIKKGLL